ncbi:OLC1v1038543C1 [Oldenlandia corymbosa var. corymbosa]|uniref:OLC1v1038543C1 n=1 Tax=Oldenlandia corymbosa var. corymbosa TaxID=529605 RepID=A0AAV1D007_OLDCO|nr:OLC1v1038543C1 [Oldenlandia corymbosa var. corymbosa]
MERWSGILKVLLHPDSTTFYRVAASLCLSPSSTSLTMPSANAIFFNGDHVEGTGDPVIERLSDLQNIAEILVSKFGSTVNAWVVDAPIFNGPFAVYKDFVPSINLNGEPKGYDATGFPASSSIVSLLANSLREANNAILPGQEGPSQAEPSTSLLHEPKTLLLGFSKGGVVLNQLLTEISSVESEPVRTVKQSKQAMNNGGQTFWKENEFVFIPSSKEDFLNSITEIHYVDVGLNTEGAYLTNKEIMDKFSDHLARRAFGIRFLLHGTPRQWCDNRRIWIQKEKNELFRLLKSVAQRNMGKLKIRERLYFANWPPSLQMHFEIIEKLDDLTGDYVIATVFDCTDNIAKVLRNSSEMMLCVSSELEKTPFVVLM